MITISLSRPYYRTVHETCASYGSSMVANKSMPWLYFISSTNLIMISPYFSTILVLQLVLDSFSSSPRQRKTCGCLNCIAGGSKEVRIEAHLGVGLLLKIFSTYIRSALHYLAFTKLNSLILQ